MVSPRKPINLTDYRSVLGTTGDIAVGAYARHQRRKAIAVAAAGLALIGGAGWLLLAWGPGDEAQLSGRYPVVIQCMNASCGQRWVIHVAPDKEAFPVTCPACGERSGYQTWECRDCEYQFVPRRTGREMRCPKCGSRRVGAAEELRDEVDVQ